MWEAEIQSFEFQCHDVISHEMVFLQVKRTYQFSKWQIVDYFAFDNQNYGDMQNPIFKGKKKITETHVGLVFKYIQ